MARPSEKAPASDLPREPVIATPPAAPIELAQLWSGHFQHLTTLGVAGRKPQTLRGAALVALGAASGAAASIVLAT